MKEQKARQEPPPPGSPEALKVGCICPTDKNKNGEGFIIRKDGFPVYAVNPQCDVHK